MIIVTYVKDAKEVIMLHVVLLKYMVIMVTTKEFIQLTIGLIDHGNISDKHNINDKFR